MSSLIGLVGGSHLLRAMGLHMEGVLHQLEHQTQRLQGLADHFERLAMAPHMLGSLLSSGALPAPMCMPPPFMGGCPCPGHYAAPRSMDLGAAPPGANFFQKLAARKAGAKLERFLNKNPFARQQFEMMMGGRIVPDGRNDGRLTVVPFPPGYFPAGGAHNAAAFSALGMLDDLSRAAAGIAGGVNAAMGGGVHQAAMLGALAGLMDGMFGAGGAGSYLPGGGAGPRSGTYMPGSGATGGFGTGGSGMPGVAGLPRRPGEGDDISALLADPSLTVEDKICLMIMMIMKKMDKEIEEQANYINKIQQQQSKGGQGGGGAGGAGGAGGGGQGGQGGGQGGSSPSIDVETMKLKRLIDKRSQMFDMLRQIIDKYNETAKNIIQSIGR